MYIDKHYLNKRLFNEFENYMYFLFDQFNLNSLIYML